MRLALGAGRARLAAQLLVETFLLSTLGGGIAVALALWGGGALRAALLPDIGSAATVLSGRVLAFTAAMAVIAAGVSGIMPALTAGRAGPGLEPEVGGPVAHASIPARPVAARRRAGGRHARAARRGGALIRSLQNLEARVGGLDADHLLVGLTGRCEPRPGEA